MMIEQPKVTVIMPVYNGEKYLEQAIDSVRTQSLKDIEFICVDDGSTDDSLNILHRYERLDSRIKVLTQKNSYAGVARNHGMQYANGEYLSFLDADDYFKPDMLDKAYLCAKQENADLVAFGVGIFKNNPDDEYSMDGWLDERRIPLASSFNKHTNSKYLFNFSGTAVWNKLFRREFINREGLFFPDMKRWEDVYFVVMALALAERISVVRENLIEYRVGNDNSLSENRDERIIDSINVLDKTYRELLDRELDDELWNSFRNECFMQVIDSLNSCKSMESFEKLYTTFNNDYLKMFHMIDMDENDFINPNDYRKFSYIKEHTVQEYVFKKYREIKEKPLPTEYIFPFELIEKDAEIILYGAGNVGHIFYRQILNIKYCSVVAWVDRKAKRLHNKKIKPIDEIKLRKFDYIVVAIEDEQTVQNIKRDLVETYRIVPEKIIWRSPEVCNEIKN